MINNLSSRCTTRSTGDRKIFICDCVREMIKYSSTDIIDSVYNHTKVLYISIVLEAMFMKIIRRNCACRDNFRHYYFILLKVLGLAPCQLQTSKIYINRNANYQKSHVFIVSYFGLIYNIFLVSAFAIGNYLVAPRVYWPESPLSPWSVGTVFVFIGNLSIIIVWIYFILWHKSIVDVANKLVYVNVELMKFNNYKIENENFDILVCIGSIVICIGLLLVGSMLASATYIIIVYIGPSIIHAWILTEYILIVTLLTRRFKNLNKTLLWLGPITTEIEFYKLFVTKTSFRGTGTIITDIIIIRRAHASLCEIFHEISNFYGFPILLILIYFSGHCIFSSFVVLLSFATHNLEITVMMRINAVLWLTTELLYVVGVTTSITKLLQQV